MLALLLDLCSHWKYLLPLCSRELFEAHSFVYESKSYCLKKTKTKLASLYLCSTWPTRKHQSFLLFPPLLFPTRKVRIGQTRRYCSDLIKSRIGTSLFKGNLSASDAVNSLRNRCSSLGSMHTRPPLLSICSATANFTLNAITKVNLLVSPVLQWWKLGHQQLQIEDFGFFFNQSKLPDEAINAYSATSAFKLKRHGNQLYGKEQPLGWNNFLWVEVFDAGGANHTSCSKYPYMSFASASLSFRLAQILPQLPVLTAYKISRMHLSTRRTSQSF